MAKKFIIYHLSICFILLLICGCSVSKALEIFDDGRIEYMSREERETLKQEAKEMFFHGYYAYMGNAYPADELMPLSCKGRYRGSEPDRGDMDSTLGNFSLTLVDTLDTLVVMGDLVEFEKAVKLVIKDVTFDTDVIVSLFETNIRMLGGLLSAHILADYIQDRNIGMSWYRDELLNLAKDLGYRFIPAFNTSTGIPFGRINLKYGMKGVPLELTRETCTACAGSMILEMAALSRLTGESIFEEKAQKAMDVLWRLRHRGTDLMGSVLNVNSGDWVRRDSGVGAGIDSYYEYCLKAYILLGDEKYLGRFNKHYQAIMKYISQGPMLLDVHMHRPNTNSKNFMDALLAFWPGLQVLKGDIKPAVETHEMLYQVMQRHNFIPEAFTTDFQVHWGHHPLRPEFLESTYFLYKATGDHYYLGVGRKVLKSLQTYARVPCGFAAVSDVRTNKHDDTMDSFVLSETFKYLFLLFADPSDLILNLDEYVFTTEGHLLPLSLASVRSNNKSMEIEKDKVYVEETDRTCPNSLHLFPASVRQPLRNMVEDVCPKRASKKRLSAMQFQPNNHEHVKLLNDMGIVIFTANDGSIKFLQTLSSAKSPQDAEEGQMFMQEILELNKQQSLKTHPILISFVKPNTQPPQKISLLGGPAQFGVDMKNHKIIGNVVIANPTLACDQVDNADELKDMIVVIDRGNCQFIDKARIIQKAGAIAGIVLDNTPTTSIENSVLFAMSSDGKSVDDVTIPFVFLFGVEASQLVQAMISAHGALTVTISGVIFKDPRKETQLKAPTDLSIIDLLKSTFKQILTRQTSQNLSSSRSTTNIPAVSSTLNEDIFTVSYACLQAQIKMSEAPEYVVKINFNTKKLDAFHLLPKKVIPNEASWRFIRKMLVNELFGTVKLNLGFRIKGSGIVKFYSIIMSKRGVDEETITNTALFKILQWFLKELSEVSPDETMVDFYRELFPNIHKQYFFGYLFRITAFNVRKYNFEEFKESSIESSVNSIIKSIDEIQKIQPGEFEKFMKEYVPMMINYIAVHSLELYRNTPKEVFDKDVFSVNEFLTINKDLITDVDPKIIFDSSEPSSKKKVAELLNKKEGVIRLELATQFDELFEELKDSAVARMKIEENLLKSEDENQEVNVPNIQVKDSVEDQIPSEKQESNIVEKSTVDSDKHDKRVHDDL